MDNVPNDVSCIVCYDETDCSNLSDWHHCRTCSAMWCDSCMEAMYNRARDSRDEEVVLSCPQCRKSVADMQLEARIERMIEAHDCTEDVCFSLLAYENLLTETLHMCESWDNGVPHYTLPLEAAARVLSRDEVCSIIGEFQGSDGEGSLRRCLRSGDLVGAAIIVLRGYVGVLGKISQDAALVELHTTAEYYRDAQPGDSGTTTEPSESRRTILRERIEDLINAQGSTAASQVRERSGKRQRTGLSADEHEESQSHALRRGKPRRRRSS